MQLTFLQKYMKYEGKEGGGQFTQQPTTKGDMVKWSSMDICIPNLGSGYCDPGTEDGFVKYSSPRGDVTFLFKNDYGGKYVTCSVTVQKPDLGGVCRTTSGSPARVSYEVYFKSVPEINASVRLHGDAAKLKYTLLAAHMNGGKFTVQPSQKADQIAWTTTGFGNGFVKYGTGGGDVTFLFSSPYSYANACKVTVENPALRGTCSITTGPQRATAAYNLQPLK